MKIRITKYDKNLNRHHFEWIDEHPTKSHIKVIDLFVGCAIDVPVEPYDEEKYDEIANSLIGREMEIDEECFSERHQMWLPSDYHILSNSKTK